MKPTSESNEKLVNVCFVSHFHQPYWQPKKIWNKIKEKSYIPWLNLLEEMVNQDEFFINIHFSGPFIVQMAYQDNYYIETMRDLISTNKLNLVLGFVDEAFIQLSSRTDDIYYQLKQYLKLSQEVFGANISQFCGVHIVEREANERLLYDLAQACQILGILPLIYLDYESFFESKPVNPGDRKDLLKKYFHTADIVHKTTIPFFPKEAFNFILRDEIGGRELFIIPFHSQYRYHLLKRRKSKQEDKIITPEDFLNILLNEKKKILDFCQKFDTHKEPLILLFSDAERLGGWSGEPEEDVKWLKKLFYLIIESKEFKLGSLQDYFKKQGFLDTYPCKTSTSYPEFNNWTGHRGIRGITFADPKLRKLHGRTTQIEKFQDIIEKLIIEKTINNDIAGINIKNIVLEAQNRYEIVKRLTKSLSNINIEKLYGYMNRFRNISYIEDGKWAVRHPFFGNQPHLNQMSLTYLDLAECIGLRILNQLNSVYNLKSIEILDWYQNGFSEIIIRNLYQNVVISRKGAQIIFHQIRSRSLVENSDDDLIDILKKSYDGSFLEKDFENLTTNICITEPDSLLNIHLCHNNSRKENCRNSGRLAIYLENCTEFIKIHDFSEEIFELEEEINMKIPRVSIKTKKNLEEEGVILEIKKKFSLDQNKLEIDLEINFDKEGQILNKLIIAPEFVFTLLPSDGINFHPHLFIEFLKNNSIISKIDYEIETSSFELSDSQLKQKDFDKKQFRDDQFNEIKIIPKTVLENKNERYPWISLKLDNDCVKNMKKIQIFPAIKEFYKNVFPEECSLLSYHTSGIRIIPFIKLRNQKKQNFHFVVEYDIDNDYGNIHENSGIINLIKVTKRK